MKKIFLSAYLLCATVIGVAAFPRILINPGHGGHEHNDRGIELPVSSFTTADWFWESEGNLTRSLYVRDFLKELGGTVNGTGDRGTIGNSAYTIALTRVNNTSDDDLDLTYIATLSNNHGGYFMSLHTNGGTASANYTIAFFKGATTSPYGEVVSPSKAMGMAVAQEHHDHMMTNESYKTPRSISDYSFWGWNYGVLRTNTRPGYLMEAWFHDYRPETLRLKSDHYNHFLAWQTVRGFYDSPGGIGKLKGCIAGDIRDLTKGCGYTGFATRGRDSYWAVNNATVTLYDSSGKQLQQVKTDKYYNGVYAFFGLATGTYTIKVTGVSGYKTAVKTVSVTENEATIHQFSLEAGTDDTVVEANISLNPASADFDAVTVGSTSDKTITVTGTGLTSNITITNSDNTNFAIDKTSLGTSGGSLKITYKPQAKGYHSTKITFNSGTQSAVCLVTGTGAGTLVDVPTFTEVWNYSENNTTKPSWIDSYANIRNMAYGDGKLYVVDAVNNKVKIINAQTGAHIKDMIMTGVSGGALALVDVAYVDGKIVGTGVAINRSWSDKDGDWNVDDGEITEYTNTNTRTLNVYVWDNDNATPRKILSTTNLGSNEVGTMDRIGDAIEIKGDLTNGEICYLALQIRKYKNASGTEVTGNCNSLITYEIKEEEVSATPTVADIDGFIVGGSPRLIPYGNDYIAVGQNYRPSVVTGAGELTKSIKSEVLQAYQGNDIAVFTFKGDTYAFATDYASGTSTDAMLRNGRATFINLTEGWANASKLASYPSNGFDSNTRNTSCSSSICVNVVDDKSIEMWVLVHNQGIAYYKHEAKEQPSVTPGVSEPTLTKVWAYESGLPTATVSQLSTSEAVFGTGYDGTVYVLDKSTTSILSWNKDSQKQTYLTDSRFAGTAITCDDAGNLLVSSGIYGSSAYKWYIVSAADKSVKEVVITDFKEATGTNATNAFGRVVGNMLSSEGAYIYTTQASTKTVNCIKIANGAFVSLTKSTATTDKTVEQTSIAQPSLETVSAINASGKASECFYMRIREQQCFMQPNGTSMKELSMPTNTHKTDGGDVFTLDGKTYVIYPTGNGSGGNGSSFVIMELSSGDVVAEETASVGSVGVFQSLVSEKVSETKANIYQYYAGGKVAMYTFEVPGVATGIESVEAEVEAPVEYYNLQGVKVANPDNGLYIKKQGKKVTKVIL